MPFPTAAFTNRKADRGSTLLGLMIELAWARIAWLSIQGATVMSSPARIRAVGTPPAYIVPLRQKAPKSSMMPRRDT